MSECEVTKVNAPKLDANPQLIVLTVEEAKGIHETINEAKAFLWNRHKIPLTESGQKDFDTLQERIWQAEGELD